MLGIPGFKEFLLESSSNDKTYLFKSLNGQLKLNNKYQETDGYDSTKSVAEPEAEMKIWLENYDAAMYYFYTGNDYEQDRDTFYKELKELMEDFDKKLTQILNNANFTK
jgi:hypothetical protein